MKFCLILCAIAVTCVPAQTPDYEYPFMVMSGGSPITLSVGHANPLVTDWNGDGLKDLMVGQYSGGKIRYYQNNDSNDSPVFDGFSYLQADGNDISLSSG